MNRFKSQYLCLNRFRNTFEPVQIGSFWVCQTPRDAIRPGRTPGLASRVALLPRDRGSRPVPLHHATQCVNHRARLPVADSPDPDPQFWRPRNFSYIKDSGMLPVVMKLRIQQLTSCGHLVHPARGNEKETGMTEQEPSLSLIHTGAVLNIPYSSVRLKILHQNGL